MTLILPWKYRDRNFHFVVDRIVIDQKAELGKHLRDLSVKVSHVFGRLRVVIGHTEQRSIAADVLDELQPLDNFTRIRAGCADEQRDALLIPKSILTMVAKLKTAHSP